MTWLTAVNDNKTRDLKGKSSGKRDKKTFRGKENSLRQNEKQQNEIDMIAEMG